MNICIKGMSMFNLYIGSRLYRYMQIITGYVKSYMVGSKTDYKSIIYAHRLENCI